jgi:hypothetical protein
MLLWDENETHLWDERYTDALFIRIDSSLAKTFKRWFLFNPLELFTPVKHYRKISPGKICTTRSYLLVGFALLGDISRWMGGEEQPS